MSGKISQDTTVPFKSSIFIPGVDMSLGVGSQNVKLLASSFSAASFVTPQQFGAVGDGITDDTAAIQQAMTASKAVYFPDGLYKVTSTLTGQAGQVLIGTQPENCQLVRTTAYGDTIDIGTPSVHAGPVTVRGLWFNHVYAFNNGATFVAGTSTTITNKDPSSVHLNIVDGQNVRIMDTWFSGVGDQIKLTDSTQIWIERCIFSGMWDSTIAGMQDTHSSIWFHASDPATRCAVAFVTRCTINGYSHSAARNITTGSVTVSHTLNNGPKYGILADSCELLDIGDSYIGGQSSNCILLSSVAILTNIKIHDNMIDGAVDYSIAIFSTAGFEANYIDIHNNTGVGYGNDAGFLNVGTLAGHGAAWRLHVCNNNIQFYLKAAIRIQSGEGVEISGNTVAACNFDGSVTSDPAVQAGCYIDAATTYVNSFGNTWGGGVNFPTAANNMKWGIYFASATNNHSALERSAGLGIAGGTLVGTVVQDYPT
jgi:hypothetical protein